MLAALYSFGKRPRILVGWFLVSLFSLAEAQQITDVSPRTFQAGETFEMEISGRNLGYSGDGQLDMLASFPFEHEMVREDPKPPEDGKLGKPRNKVRLKITVKEDAPLGFGWMRLVTSRGITLPTLLLVDDLATQKVQPKTRLEEAVTLNLPIAVESRTPNLDIHYYKVEAKAGQRVAIEVIGSRLGEDVDPVLKLVDDKGRILETSDDEPGSGKDPRLAYNFKEDTTAYIEVRDVRYRGGKFYRLRVGNFPLPLTAFPMVTQAGLETTFSAVTESGNSSLSQTQTASGNYGTSSGHSVGFRGEQQDAAGYVPIRLEAEPVILEKEPNDQTSEAIPVESSATINGRLDKLEDVDIYAFNVNKGQHLHFRPYCSSLGSPTFLRLSLEDEKGRTLASAGEGNSAEESLQHVAGADGKLFLHVRELAGRGGPAFTYAISADLQATPIRFQWEPGKNSPLSVLGQPGSVVSLKLKSIRKNFGETVKLTPVCESRELKVFGSSDIDKNKGSFDFEFHLPEDMKPGEWDLLTLRANFHKEGMPSREWNNVLDLQHSYQTMLPTVPFPPAELLSRVPFSIMPRKIDVVLDPIEGKPGEEVEINVSVKKLEKSFRFFRSKAYLHGFPKEWKVPNKPHDLPEDKGFTIIKLKIPKQAAAGEEFEVHTSVRGEPEGAHFMRVFSNKVLLKVTGEEESLVETK